MTAPAPPRPGRPAAAIVRLLAYRIDAWGVGAIVALLALQIHGRIELGTAALPFLVVASYWLAYTLNDFFDAPHDALEPAKAERNLFVRYAVDRRRAALGFAIATGLLALGFAAFGLRGLLGGAVSLAAAWAYSSPPLRLKSRPGLDLATHCIFVQTYTYFLCLLVIDAEWLPIDALILGINFLASLSGQLAQQVRDFEVDSRSDVNFATTVGLRATAWSLRGVTASLVILVAFGFGFRWLHWTLLPFALAFLPTAALRIGNHEARRPRRWITVATGASIFWAALLAASALL
jgi:chlorophyll synthase